MKESVGDTGGLVKEEGVVEPRSMLVEGGPGVGGEGLG